MTRRLAWGIWAASTVLWAVCVWLYVASGLPPIPDGSDGGMGELGVLSVRVAGFLGVSTIAAIVAVRQPSNLFGWTAGVAALMSVMQVFANRYTADATIVGEWPLLGSGAWIAWFAGCLSAASVSLVTVAFLVMPSGRLSSPRWRVVVAIGFGLGVIGVVAAALSPGPLANTPWIINPLGVPAAASILLPIATLSALGGLVCILLAAASVPLRLRRAQGDERLQIKLIVYGTCIFAVGYLGSSRTSDSA